MSPHAASAPAELARARLRDGLLGWGQSRPPAPTRLAAQLRAQLEDELGAIDMDRVIHDRRDGRLWVTKTRLDRLVCDGYALDARPYEHTWTNARGALTHKAIERDWSRHERDPATVVAAAWRELASDRPGDPRSLGAWLNGLDAGRRAELAEEVTVLLTGFREVWPPLEGIEVIAEPRVRLRLAGGRIVLFGVPDLVLRSPRHDDRSRTLVVDLKTGRPRSERDRHELRFYALLATLDEGRPPFRWGTHYVTEGRSEWEDLDPEILRVTARRIVDGVQQAVRLAAADTDDLQLVGGAWCRFCLREDTCEVAAQARASGDVSQGPGIIGP